MRKGDFSLEILVNNEVLPEYEVPLNEKTKLTRSREKENITYVAVPYSKSFHFCIRVGVHSTLGSMVYKGIHYVDGQNDDTYMELNPLNDDPYTYIYGFYNYDNTIFHKFKFDTNCWTEDEIFVSNIPRRCTAPCDKKDFGVISVYVFTAERLHGKRFMSQSKNNQEEMIPESPDLDKIDPQDIIYLDEPQEEPIPNLRATSNKPIAELHIRYQTKEWLRNEGFNLIEDSLNSTPNTTLLEDRVSDDEVVTSEEITDSTDYDRNVNMDEEYLPSSIQSEEITDSTDDDSKNAKIDEEYPSSIISDVCNDDEAMENINNFEYDNDKDEEGESLKEKENESPNYRVIRENPNEQVANKPLDVEAVVRIERNFDYETENRIFEIVTERNIKNTESAANERLNERIKEISINDKEENRTFNNNKDEDGEDLMVIDRNEFEKKIREFIDLTVEPPKEIIEISDDDGDGDDGVDGVILVETVKSFLPTTVNKKKHRSKKIKYYSDSSIDWNNDDSSNYSDSSSEDEFVSISKKRLRT